jgi:polar amino acid transport system permease protein
MGYQWDFSAVWFNSGDLLAGLLGTLQVTLASLAFGLPAGLLACAMRLWGGRIAAAIAIGYIAVFRTTPPLVQLFWIFYALPIVVDVKLEPFDAAVIALSLQSGAFFAEVFRGGIVSVERGTWEAGRAIGLQRWTLLRRIVLPIAIKRMMPAFLERVIELMKTTSLVSAIAYADLLYTAMVLSAKTFRPLEIFTTVALMYFVVLFGVSLATRAVEARLARSG